MTWSNPQLNTFQVWCFSRETSTDLLEDLVDVDLVGLDGLGLLLAGPRGSLLHHLLGCRCLSGRGLDSLLSDLGSHCVCLCACMRERVVSV